MTYTISNTISKSGCLIKDYAPGMEAFGSAVVHYKSGALGMNYSVSRVTARGAWEVVHIGALEYNGLRIVA